MSDTCKPCIDGVPKVQAYETTCHLVPASPGAPGDSDEMYVECQDSPAPFQSYTEWLKERQPLVTDLNSEQISGRDKVEITNCVFCINGYCPWFAHVENGRCFRCNGTGKERTDWKDFVGNTISFQKDDLIWQFLPMHREDETDEQCGVYHSTNKKEEVTNVIILVASVREEFLEGAGIFLPKGYALRELKANMLCKLLYTSVSPIMARTVWDGVRAGELHLSDLTDELLEDKGQRGGYTNWL